MLVTGINKILNWCQVISHGRRYTCPTKLVDGHLYFAFKREWHLVEKYISDNTFELVRENGKNLMRECRL